MLSKMPKLGSVSGQMLLREAYDITYGIHDHNDPVGGEQHPLGLVEFHYAEDCSADSLLYERIEQYKKERIWDHFHLSLDEFLKKPTDTVIRLLEIATHHNAIEDRVAQRLQAAENQMPKRS